MHHDALDISGGYKVEIFLDIVGEIIELLKLVDGPTDYMMSFTVDWFLVLVITAIIFKKRRKIIFRMLAFVPLLNFAVFYLINYTKGAQLIGFLRYGPGLAAALIYLAISLWISKGKRKVLPLIINGILVALISAWSVFYVLALGNSYHFGNFSHPGYKKSMTKLIDELEANYVLRDYKEIDFEALRAEYIPMAAEAQENKDEEAFAEAVAKLCYEFHDGHLSINITDDELAYKVSEKMAGNDYGFSMIRTDDGKTTAILTDENSDAYNKGIRNGVVITSWDGVPVDEAIANTKCVQFSIYMVAYPIAENEEVVKPIFLAGRGGDSVKVRFIDESGAEKEIAVKSSGSYLNRLNQALYPLTDKWCYEFAEAKMIDDHCGYLCIPWESFDSAKDISAALVDEYPELKELLVSRIEGLKAQGMDRLVIDIRGNDGGIDVVYEEVVSLFTKETMVAYGGFYDGKNYVKSEKWAWTVEPDGRYSDIPVVVLVNAGTASSGDMLAYRLSNCPNVTMMGVTTTWGSAQSLGGMCLLSGGKIQVRYPIIATLGENNEILVDAGKDRVSTIRLDEKIPLDSKAVKIYYEIDGDYDLAYARIYLNKKFED